MHHPHAVKIGNLYTSLKSNNPSAALELTSDRFTFQVAGKSVLAGKHLRGDFVAHYWDKLKALSQQSIEFTVHDILASDLHVTVLASVKLKKNNQPIEYRTVHVWRFEAGIPVAGYEYPRDLYHFDETWSS